MFQIGSRSRIGDLSLEQIELRGAFRPLHQPTFAVRAQETG